MIVNASLQLLCRYLSFMWTCLFLSIHAFLHLSRGVQCYEHSNELLSRSVVHGFTANSPSRNANFRNKAYVLSNDGRLLQQAPRLGSEQADVKTLDQLCPNRNSTSATFTCEPAEITLSPGQSLEIEMQMPKDTTAALALEVIVTPSTGDADLAVYNVNGDSKPQIGFSQVVGTGRDFVFVESENAPPGSNLAIQIFSASGTPTTFVMLIEVLEEGNGDISERDSKVLRAMSVACCSHGGCEATLGAFASKSGPANACRDLPNWHCNGDGHITHMQLTNQGMKCDLESLHSLSQLTELHRFELNNATGVEGDINVFLNAFAQKEHLLKVLIIRNTGISGELPATCTSDSLLGSLLQLHIESSPVGGSIPDCVMGLSSVTIKDTDITGPLPKIPANSPLQVLELIQKNNGAERITGDAAALADLLQLTNMRLENTGLTGVLTAGPRVREVVTVGSQHDSFKPGVGPGDDFELTTVSMTEGRMTGPVPTTLLTAPALTFLSLRGNRFTSVPQDWGVTTLRVVDLSENSIEGPLPPGLGKQPALESADLSSNLFSGPLDTFTSELPDDSRMYRLNLAFNSLTGPVSGLGKLGVFQEVAAATGPSGRAIQTSTHVLNISSNNFQGELPFEFYGAASAGGPAKLPRLDIYMTDNPLMICPDPETQSQQVVVLCDSDATANATASAQVGAQSPSSSKESLSAGSIAAVCISLLIVFALMAAGLYYYQKRWGKTDGTYVPYTENSASLPQDSASGQQMATLNIEQA